MGAAGIVAVVAGLAGLVGAADEEFVSALLGEIAVSVATASTSIHVGAGGLTANGTLVVAALSVTSAMNIGALGVGVAGKLAVSHGSTLGKTAGSLADGAGDLDGLGTALLETSSGSLEATERSLESTAR
jgi:hypothetical protein